MLTGHRNEDLAEMLEDVEAGANPAALLRTVVGAIIELREAAHHTTTVPPTDYSDEGDSGAEEEGQEEGEEEGEGEGEGEVVVEGEGEVAEEGGGGGDVGGDSGRFGLCRGVPWHLPCGQGRIGQTTFFCPADICFRLLQCDVTL